MPEKKTGAWGEEDDAIGADAAAALDGEASPHVSRRRLFMPSTALQLNSMEEVEFSLGDLNLGSKQAARAALNSEEFSHKIGDPERPTTGAFEHCFRPEKSHRKRTQPDAYPSVGVKHGVVNSDILEYLFSVQSLLLQLTVPETRGDFLSGRIVALDDPEMLLYSLDQMRDLFLCQSPSALQQRNSAEMVTHLKLLITADNKPFVLTSVTPQLDAYEYSSWNRLLSEIIVSDYWTRQCKSSDWEIGLRPLAQLPAARRRVKGEPSSGLQLAGRSENIDDVSAVLPGQFSVGMQMRTPIEEIVIDSTDSSDNDTVISFRHERSHARSNRQRAVMPPVFDVGGNYSMRQFLDLFERGFMEVSVNALWNSVGFWRERPWKPTTLLVAFRRVIHK